MSDTTPPNWPIYNVRLTDEQISDIVNKVYASSKTATKTNLGKKKSFNNRIYFVHVEYETREDDLPTEIVLKVNGRFFGSSKVQNEVSCLLLLQHYCPDVQAPKVIAWSEDGSKICAIRNGVFAVLYDEVVESDEAPIEPPSQGWIMTTKLPGRILQREELIANDQLVPELADVVASWRTNIPHRSNVGNLKLQPADYTSLNTLHGLEIMADGLILCESQPSIPVVSSTAYYTHLLSDQIRKIETKDVFAYARERLLNKLQSFKESVLLHLLRTDQTEQDKVSVFTQQDFAPRNVLVQIADDGKLHVSGIVDFEFAGLFPQSEEFLTCRARQSDDWPEDVFESLCSGLAVRGLSVPGYNSQVEEFDVLRDLAVLTENVAPWWLEDGHITGQELEKQLAKTCEIVEDIIGKLSEK